MIVKRCCVSCMSHDGRIFAFKIGQKRVRITDESGTLLRTFTTGSAVFSMCFSLDDTKLYLLSFSGRSLTVVDLSCPDGAVNTIKLHTKYKIEEVAINSLFPVCDNRLVFIGKNRNEFTDSICAIDLSEGKGYEWYRSPELICCWQYDEQHEECLMLEAPTITRDMAPATISRIRLTKRENGGDIRQVLIRRALEHPCTDGGENLCYANYAGLGEDILLTTARRVERYAKVNGKYELQSSYLFSPDEMSPSPMACQGAFVLGKTGYMLIWSFTKREVLLYSIEEMRVIKHYHKHAYMLSEAASIGKDGRLMLPFEPDGFEKGLIGDWHIFTGNVKDLLAGEYDEFLHAQPR